MYLTGTETWCESVKTSPLFCVGTRLTLKTGKWRPRQLCSTERRTYRYAWVAVICSLNSRAICQLWPFTVLWHQCKEQLQLWEAFPVAGPKAGWGPQSWLCWNASTRTTRSSDGSQPRTAVRTGNQDGRWYSPSWWRGGWWSINESCSCCTFLDCYCMTICRKFWPWSGNKLLNNDWCIFAIHLLQHLPILQNC